MVKLHHRLSDKAMPPKPKYTKEEIVDAAFELAREKGIDAVVAREVGKRLNTSSTPIFTVFDNMEELKNEVFQRAKNMFIQYMDDVLEYQPAFKEFGMRWVRFAKEEPNLYSFLFLNGIQHDCIVELLTEDFKELSARIEGASGQYQEIPFTLDNISIPSISLDDKKAELKFQSLKINSLENLTSNIFTKVELDNGSLSLDYNEGIKIALGLDSIISPKSNVSGDMLIGFDVELAFGDNTLQSFSVVSRDMYLGYGEKKDNSLVIKGDIDKAQLILEYGKINLDLLLGFNDKSFNGKMDLSDYPISVIYALLKDYSVDVDKYIPSTSSISCSLDVNGKYSELSKLFLQGDISYSVDLSSIKYGEIETYIKSKGYLSFKDESVAFS